MKKLLSLLLLVSSYAFGGTVTGQITTATSGPIINGTLTLTPTQAFVVTGTATVVSSAVACYTDASGNVVGEPNPLVAPVVTPNTGSGTLPAGTYFTRFNYKDASGRSFYSFETTTILTSTGSLIVNAPVKQPATATAWDISISTSSGTETLQGTVTGTPGTWANYTQSVPLVAGSALPASNTTACKPYFSDEGIPGFSYLVGLTNSSGSNVSGFPQRWRLFGGSAGTVNLSLGMPISDGVVVYPQPIISTPAFNATQSILGGLNLNGFPLLGVSNLAVSGNVSGVNGNFSGNVLIGGTLGVTGNSTFSTGDFINTGVFTDTQMNQYMASNVGSLNFLSEFQLAEGNHGSTEAFSGGIVTPVAATVLQAAAINGYAVNSSPTTFNFGGYFQSRCAVNGTKCGGINPVAFDTTGNTASQTMYISDGVIAPRNANTAYSIVEGYSSSLAGPANAQGYGQAFDASSQSTSFWNFAFRSRNGAATTALQVGAGCTAGTCSSQGIALSSMSGGVQQDGTVTLTPSGLLNFNSPSTNNLQISDGTHSNTATIASGTAVMTTAGIGTGACGSTVTVAATGVATTDIIDVTRNAAATIGNGGGLTLNAWPTAGNVNFNYCNSAAGTITPTAMTVNWKVIR